MKKLRSCTNSRGTQICETKSWLARQKSAGILDVFQAFLTMPTAILAAKLCAEAIGTASKFVGNVGRDRRQSARAERMVPVA